VLSKITAIKTDIPVPVTTTSKSKDSIVKNAILPSKIKKPALKTALPKKAPVPKTTEEEPSEF
jgi:hypothetical protein